MKLVETINCLAGELFTVQFSHSGFDSLAEGGMSEVLRITPDETTRALMKNYGMGSSFGNDVFFCYIRSRRAAPPALSAFVVPEAGLRFRFFVNADARFMNATLIEPVANDFVYYFSNRTNAGTGLFLSHDAGNVNDNDLHTVTDVGSKETFMGVIDIFSSGAVSPDYDLFVNPAGELRAPVYHIQFGSRI